MFALTLIKGCEKQMYLAVTRFLSDTFSICILQLGRYAH